MVTQTGRRGGVLEVGTEAMRHREAVAAVAESAVPHSHGVDENQE